MPNHLKLLFSLVFFTLVACEQQLTQRELTKEELALFGKNGISREIANQVGGWSESVEQLMTYDDDFQEVMAEGVLLKVKKNAGETVTIRVREQLAATSYQAYLYENNYGFDSDEVAVVPTKNEIDYLKIAQTNGWNYDISPQQVIERYQQWQQRYDLTLVAAGMDWLEADVGAENVDWESFAAEVFEFCPDVVWQGTGSVEALEKEMKDSKSLYLWWD